MDKPKGGRGLVAPYETKQMRVPEPLEEQIQELIARYRAWISRAGTRVIGANNPPRLLDVDKPVDSFKLDQLEKENAELRLQLAATQAALAAAEAEKRIAERTAQQLPDLEAARDRFLADLGVGKQAPQYKRARATINKFLALLEN